MYIIVDEDVYDLTKFQEEHPGRCMLICCSQRLTDHSQGGRKVRYLAFLVDATH